MSGNIRAIESKKIIELSGSITREANTTAYVANDVIADDTGDELIHCTTTREVAAASGAIVQARLKSDHFAATAPALNLYVFRIEPTKIADNAAINLADVDLNGLVGIIPVAETDWVPGDPTSGAGGNQIAVVNLDPEIPTIINRESDVPTLWVMPVCTAGYTPAANAETFTLSLAIRLN